MSFKELKPAELDYNGFTLFSKDWALLTAEKDGKVNTMTVSWGGTGHLWNKDVVTVYVRPQRFTKEFIDGSTHFSLSVLPDSFRDKLVYLGRTSGRDEDKIAKAGLTVAHKDGVPYFEEATTVFTLRKLFASEMKEEHFIDRELIPANYPNKDYHTIYIGEITSALVSE